MDGHNGFEKVFENVFHGSADANYLCIGKAMSLAYVNPVAQEVWQYSAGNPVSQVLHEQNVIQLNAERSEVLRSGVAYLVGCTELLFKAGGKWSIRYYRIQYQPYLDAEHNIVGVFCTESDITAAIKQSAGGGKTLGRINDAFMEASVGICIFSGRPAVAETVNGKFLSFLGTPRAAFERHPLAGHKGEIFDFLDRYVNEVLVTGISCSVREHEIRLRHRGSNGSRFVDLTFVPLKDGSGGIGAIEVIAVEVTEKVNARKNARAAEGMFRQLVLTSPFIFLILQGPDFIVEFANHALFDYWQKNPEETLGRPLLEVLPELGDQSFPEILSKVYRTGEPYGEKEKVHFLQTNGGTVKSYVTFHYQPVFDKLGAVTAIMVAAKDVSEEVNAKMSLKASRESLELALDAAEMGTFDHDLVTGRMSLNQRFREIFGIGDDRTISFESDFLQAVHGQDRDRIRETIFSYTFDRQLSSGKYDVEYRISRSGDKKVKWIRSKGKVFFDGDKPVRFLGSAVDITMEKTMDEIKSNLVSVASHELKTPVTTLKALVQLLLFNAKKEGDAVRAGEMGRLERQVNRMSFLIGNFLNSAVILEGKLTMEMSTFDLGALLEEIENDAVFLYRSHKIALNCCGGAYVHGDRAKIGQVIEILLNNADKYSPPGSFIDIICRRAGGFLEVSVSDEGIGVSEGERSRIFERFYRVADERMPTSSGFGLGLFLAAEILRRHGSEIGVKSNGGKGSIFCFKLPVLKMTAR